MSTKELQDLTRKVIDRNRDLLKMDLLKLVCASYSKGEFGDDPEMVAPVVLAFVGGVLTDDVSKVRQAMSTLKMEKFLNGLSAYKLEKLFKK